MSQVATKSGQDTASTEQVEELLDAVDMTLDRLKTLYEQYFLGIQKQAPAFIHNDVERKLRDLTQINIRNTGLRYRLATLQQKFGSYNSYWRRTLRQIENGTYARNLAKIGREAARTGSDIPDEILAAMPKRMREQVLRDRDQALAIAKRRNQVDEGAVAADTAFAPDETVQLDDEALLAQAPPKREAKTRSGAHVLSEDDADIDFNALFSAFEDDAPKVIERARRESARLGAMSQASPPPAGSPAGAPSAGTPRPGTSSQTMTQPLPRPQMPRMPVPTTATPPAGSAAPGTPPPGSTTAIPRPMTQTPSAPIQATGPIPVMAPPATQTSAIPRPVGQQASGPTQAIPRPPGVHQTGPTQAIPRPPGVQQTGGTQAIPRPPGPAAPPIRARTAARERRTRPC